MNFKVIEATEQTKFDSFIASVANGHIFQSWTWGEVKKAQWQPLRVVLEDGEKIVAAATILKRPLPVVNKCFFYLPRGPVLADWHNKEVYNTMIASLKELAQKHQAIFIKIDPCLPEGDLVIQELLAKSGFKTAAEKHGFGGLQPRYTFRLNISGSLDDLMGKLPKKTRYKVRYGSKKGLTFSSPGGEGLADFIAVLEQTAKRADFVIREKDYYTEVYRLLSAREEASLILGHYQNQVITAGVTFAFGDKAWAIYGGQVNQYRNIYAYHAIIWERVKWAKEKGALWFDFYGVPGQVDEDNPLYGIYQFKKSFGGDFFAFIGEKDLVLSPTYYLVWTKLLPLYRQAMLKLTKVFRKKTSEQ